MAQLNFDATNVPQADVMEVVPAGWYNAAIDQSEMKPAKTEGNYFLETRFNILDGQYAGRKLFILLNLRNSNPVAQEIAYKQLSSICHSVGVIQCADSSQLHGIPMKVKVKVRAASGDYEASNEITGFKNINDNTGGAAPAAGAAQPAWATQQAQPAAQQQAAPAAAQPAAGTAQPAWKAPAAAQPWAAPAAQPAPAQPAAQPAPAAQPEAQPAWMTQPAAGAAQATAGAAPPWAQQPQQ